jgi:hypothetical protein
MAMKNSLVIEFKLEAKVKEARPKTIGKVYTLNRMRGCVYNIFPFITFL